MVSTQDMGLGKVFKGHTVQRCINTFLYYCTPLSARCVHVLPCIVANSLLRKPCIVYESRVYQYYSGRSF